MTAPEPLDARLDDGVGRLTLNRPAAGNAIDFTLARELSEITSAWAADPSLRVVVLRGAGSRFCVGGDLKSFAARDDLPVHLAQLTTHLHAAIGRLARMDAPVLAAVHGSAAGAGMSLACAADIVLAAASARFVVAYTAIGLSPDGSATWSLPRLAGMRHALDLALTNRPLAVAEAAQLGLVTRVVADEDLDAETEAVVAALRDGPRAALAATKRLIRTSLDHELETQMERETEALVRNAATADGREGIDAFLSKRQPRFGLG
jgi:2-(1,2-epoxy-1,2-dihydrophenyl)acetyl-CoA isomerase